MRPASLNFQSPLGVSGKCFPSRGASGNFQVMEHYIEEHAMSELEEDDLLQPSSIIVNGPITSIAVQISDQKTDPLSKLFELSSRGQTLETVRWGATMCKGNHRPELGEPERALNRRRPTNRLRDHVASMYAMVLEG